MTAGNWFLTIFAVAGWGLAIAMGNNFIERADKMNKLTAKLGIWETQHGDLPQNIHCMYWIDSRCQGGGMQP